MTVAEMLRLIVDIFTGADGGISFVEFRFMLEGMEKASKSGDMKAKQVLLIVERFCRLLKVTTKYNNNEIERLKDWKCNV